MNCALLVSRRVKKEQVAIMRKVKTHFEQIPIEIVKKIADEQKSDDSDDKEIKGPNVVVETPATKTEPYSITSVIYCRNRA
jgi:hypothetical protein